MELIVWNALMGSISISLKNVLRQILSAEPSHQQVFALLVTLVLFWKMEIVLILEVLQFRSHIVKVTMQSEDAFFAWIDTSSMMANAPQFPSFVDDMT